MRDDDITRYLEMHEPLPDWAEKKADPKIIQPMQQLYTKNGRAHGNATMVRILHTRLAPEINGLPDPLYEVVTDANNWARYSHSELMSAYRLGDFILKSFPNPKSSHEFTRDLPH